MKAVSEHKAQQHPSTSQQQGVFSEGQRDAVFTSSWYTSLTKIKTHEWAAAARDHGEAVMLTSGSGNEVTQKLLLQSRFAPKA